MARPPLVIDGEDMGRLYLIDLGSGATLLMIEQEGQATSYPIGSDDARRIASYLRAAHALPGPGRPPGTRQAVSEDDLRELVACYTSDEAAAHDGARANYAAQQLGLNPSQVYSRLGKARDMGIYDGQAK